MEESCAAENHWKLLQITPPKERAMLWLFCFGSWYSNLEMERSWVELAHGKSSFPLWIFPKLQPQNVKIGMCRESLQLNSSGLFMPLELMACCDLDFAACESAGLTALAVALAAAWSFHRCGGHQRDASAAVSLCHLLEPQQDSILLGLLLCGSGEAGRSSKNIIKNLLAWVVHALTLVWIHSIKYGPLSTEHCVTHTHTHTPLANLPKSLLG